MDYSPEDIHQEDYPISPGNNHTLTNLQRSMTTKGAGGVYGNNPWEEDEYVDPGGSNSSRTPTPTGGPAARRINQQQRKMQTVKLPKNPFIDSDDYADMTGHMNRASGMAELRNAHQYKSMISRSPHTVRQDFQAAFDDAALEGDGVFTRNHSGSSVKSVSRSPMIKRSDTTPTLSFQATEFHTVSADVHPQDIHSNGHVAKAHPSIIEVDGPDSYRGVAATMKPTSSPHPDIKDRSDSVKKEPLIKSSSVGAKAAIPHLPVLSPAHSTVSAETVVTTVPPSTPASPAVVYKSQGESLEANVAIVIEETGPISPRYARGATSSDLTRDIKFEDPSAGQKRCWCIIPIFVLCVAVIIGLAAAVAVLAGKISDQQNQIDSLMARLSSEISTTHEASADDTTTFHTFTTAYADETTATMTEEQATAKPMTPSVIATATSNVTLTNLTTTNYSEVSTTKNSLNITLHWNTTAGT